MLVLSLSAQAVAGTSQLPYVEVEWEDPEDFRHLCDRCATSISDMRRTCACCAETSDGYDLCMHCCGNVRGPDRVRAKLGSSFCSSDVVSKPLLA